jgi:hypothetical protein
MSDTRVPFWVAGLGVSILLGIGTVLFFATTQFAVSNRWNNRHLELTPEVMRLRDRNPELYRTIADKLSEAFRRGLSQDEIEAVAQEMFDRIIDDYLSRAPDDVLLEYNEIKLAYMKGLTDRDPEICVALSTTHEGARYKADRLEALLPEMAKREKEFNMRLLERGPGNATVPSDEEIQPIVDKIEPIVARNPNWQENRNLPKTLTPEQFKPACNKAIAFFDAVFQLPRREAATLFRYLSPPRQP